MNIIELQKWWRKYLEIRNFISRGDERLINKYLNGKKRIKLTKEQSESIQQYWKPIVGHRVTEKWHELLYTLSGVFKPSYLPWDLYVKIIAHNNNTGSYSIMSFLDDKCMYRKILNGFNLPERIAECSQGVCYLPEITNKEVPQDRVISYCHNISNCIIKPSVNSSGGSRIRPLEVVDGFCTGGGGNFSSIIEQYKGNYVIERKIKNNANLSALNPTSVNTIRFHTWRDRENSKVIVLSQYIRIGRSGQIIDNASAGGIACAISNDGILRGNAVSCFPYACYDKTDSGIVLKGYVIEHFSEMREIAIAAHSQLPYFGLVGWDITMNDENKVVIIEYNPDPDLRIEQLVFNDSCLGIYQTRIVEDMLKR